MNTPPNHDEVCEMLPDAALEILEGSDLQRVLDHVRECPECTRVLREYREVAAGLALLAPWRPLHEARSGPLRARLLARAREDLHARAVDSARVAGVPRIPRAISAADRWMGWMVAAGLAGVLLMHHAVHRPLDYGWLAAGVLTIVLVAVGGYARVQRGRASALRARLTAVERELHPPHDEGE